MRQVKRLPKDREYDFGIGITDQFGLRKKSGDFVTEKEVKTYEIPEKYLEVKRTEKLVVEGKVLKPTKGIEKKDWVNELPEGADRIVFGIEVEIIGGDKEQRRRMVDQFERELKDYVRQKGSVIFTVTDIKIIKKRKKKE